MATSSCHWREISEHQFSERHSNLPSVAVPNSAVLRNDRVLQGEILMTPGSPQPIGDILAQLMARRGYARVESGGTCAAAWREAAGEAIAACSRATEVRRGVLQVFVEHSTMIQELGYQKSGLLERLAELLPDENIRDLKLRVGPLP
jgi:hypothetical protein